MKIIYMGTPDFAVKPLQAISEAGHEIQAVFTQPDRQKGRGKKLSFSDVKQAAIDMGLEDKIYQPEKLRDEEYVEIIRRLEPDMIVVAAYGQILPVQILEIPKYGCVNIHASLLPKYRGASPIETAILNGDKTTGVTIMYMAKGLDTGDMISKGELPIEGNDTTLSLTDKLSVLGAELIVKATQDIGNGTADRVQQKDEESSTCGKFTKDMGRLDFSKPAEELERLIRALIPWPYAFTAMEGKSLKILGAEVLTEEDAAGLEEAAGIGKGTPGSVINVTKKNFIVRCSDGALKITKLQPEGKKEMECVAFLNGYKVSVGDVLG